MKKNTFTFLVGGKAGAGVKKAGLVASSLFSGLGRFVFQMDDYQSLIRGGHNFAIVSTSADQVFSHYDKADLVVALDARSYEKHKDHLAEGGIIVYDSDLCTGEKGIGIPLTSEARKFPDHSRRIGVGAVAVLVAMLDLDKDHLVETIRREYHRDTEYNITFAENIYSLACSQIKEKHAVEKGVSKLPVVSGNEAIALGAAAGGLDVYIAYPMTPASSILHFLASKASQLKIAVMHVESEIAVANMALGASSAGARAMVGTSGGGFALMQEAFSLAGIAETPILFVLSSRPGPATGIPTYTSQGDLNFALGAGHGEFPRIVASPGTIEEAFYLTAELQDLTWKYQLPAILLTEKHLSESRMTANLNPEQAKWAEPVLYKGRQYKRYLDTPDGVSPLLFPPSDEVIKWNSYEHDEDGITTEDGNAAVLMCDKRNRKRASLIKHLHTINTLNTFGRGDPVICTYGSTTMSVLEALKAGSIQATVIQPRYIQPFPAWDFEQYKDRKVIVVETNSTGQFASLIHEKTGITPAATIQKYNGRPFDPLELADRIKEVI